MKLIAKIISILLFPLILTACGNKNQKENSIINNTPLPQQTENSNVTPSPSPMDQTAMTLPQVQKTSPSELRLVKKTEKVRYILSNGIEIKYQKQSISTDYGQIDLAVPQFTGLVDKNLEQKINESLLTDIDMETKNYASELGKLPLQLYCSIQLNANNLLAISIVESNSTPVAGFLYRLTDGARLYLKDIFTEGTDYVPLLNTLVTEGIIGGQEEEDAILKKPFETIKPDQDFVISPTVLYVIFHTGESGFVKRDSIGIPLSKIDDYVNVMDLYSGTERKNHEKPDLIVRTNNIFITSKAEIRKKENGSVWITYPEISGLRDPGFEKIINDTIINAVNEAADNEAIKSLTKLPNQPEDRIAVINMSPVFNHYGILSVSRYANSNEKGLQNLAAVYSFDLFKKKRVEPKSILSDYISKNKGTEQVFVNLVKDMLKTSYLASKYNNFSSLINSSVNYQFILNNSIIYFNKYYSGDETSIVLMFKENSIKGIPEQLYCSIPMKNVISMPLEDLFGW